MSGQKFLDFPEGVRVFNKENNIKEKVCLVIHIMLFLCRNFFLTQFSDHENLEETGILEIDLAKVSLDEKERTRANRESKYRRSSYSLSLTFRPRPLKY